MYKVLVLAYYFPPMGLSGVQRTLKFVKYMKQFNWEPHVLTTAATGYFAHDQQLLDEATLAGIKVTRVGGKDINSLLSRKGTVKIPPEKIRKLLSYISSIFFIPDNKVSWAKKAYTEALKMHEQEKFHLIYVTAPPFSAINSAVELKENLKIPLVIDYRDLWFGNQFHVYPTPLHSQLHKKMEYRALKKADMVIATNRRMKEKMINQYKFLTFEDIFIIPQGFDPADFQELTPEKKPNTKMRITYSGLFYEHITPRYFLSAFKQLQRENPEITANIELHFLGFLRNENMKLVKKLKLQEYVKEHGYLNHKDSLVKVMMSDILWIMVGKGRNSDTISSGKLYEYFGTGKPIIASLPDGALRTAAEEYGASFITEPDDIDAIKDSIRQSYKLYLENNLPQPNAEFVEKHRRDNLTEQLTKQFQFLVKVDP
jgi:glycosyltransferase involved in cell wall biosynthesis